METALPGTGISIGDFTVFNGCSNWNKTTEKARSMYNTHPWLSRQFYGKKVRIIFEVLRYVFVPHM